MPLLGITSILDWADRKCKQHKEAKSNRQQLMKVPHHVLPVRLPQDVVHGGPDLVLHGVGGLEEASGDATPKEIRVDVVDSHLCAMETAPKGCGS